MQRHPQVCLSYRVLAVVIAFLLSPLPQFAQSGNKAGTVSALRTAVSRNSAAIKAKETVNWNDLLQTDQGGRVRVALDDGSILSVGTSSQMRVVSHDPKLQQTSIELAYGKMRSQVVKLTAPGSRFEIRTPTAVAGVIGTDFFLDVTPTGTRLVVYEGVVALTPILAGAVAASQSVQVTAGNTAEVNENGVSGPNPTQPGVADDTIAQTAVESAARTAEVVQAGAHGLRNTLIGVALIGGAIVGGTLVLVKTDTFTPQNRPPQKPPVQGGQARVP
jgi:hypothetical protein